MRRAREAESQTRVRSVQLWRLPGLSVLARLRLARLRRSGRWEFLVYRADRVAQHGGVTKLGAMKLFDLSGEVAVVVGGTGVLGGAVAHGLAEAGARVAVVGRNAARGEARVAAIRASGGTAAFCAADALDAGSLAQARGRIESELGMATVLFNGAGGVDPNAVVTAERPLEAMPLEAWARNFDLNLVGGALVPCQVFGPGMVQRGRGSVINVASVSAHVPLSRVIAYSAAKAAVLSLTQFLSREWAPHGVRVNSITPGFFPAEQNRRALFEENGTLTARGKAAIAHTPMGRFGDPKELAGVAVFLASSAASGFVTGTDVRVDGGFLSYAL
jgi:NAD(P)-dependent dehydrogenase (short-subunit alcohol dehydrogenase family)